MTTRTTGLAPCPTGFGSAPPWDAGRSSRALRWKAPAPPQVAISLRAITTKEIFDILCRAHDLTRRERQLVALMLAGLGTDQLARALYISPYTVTDHLTAIFAKTGVRSRRELTS